MSVDELTKKTTIEFPRPIGREHAEKMLCYISSHLPGDVNGKVEYFINYRCDSKKKDSLEEKGTLTLFVNVNNSKKIPSFDTFVSSPWKEDSSLISKIEFQKIPGFELSEYRPEVIELWDDVRKVVNKYFEEVLKEK